MIRLVRPVILVIYLMLVTYGIGFIGWNSFAPRSYTYYVLSIGVPFFVFNIISKKIRKSDFSLLLVYLALMPLISCFSKQIILGESAFSVSAPILLAFAFMFYFVMKYLKVEEKDVVKAIVSVGVTTAVIQVFQQLFPNYVFFDAYKSDYYHLSLIEIRNNFSRYLVGSVAIQLLCLYYFWSQLSSKFSVLKLIFTCLLLVSVYLYLTRQILVATALTIVVSSFFSQEKKTRRFSFILTICFVLGIIYNWKDFFGEFVSMTQHDSYSTDIRWKCMLFFLDRVVSNPIGLLLGFGESHFEEQWYRLGFYASDIGFIGDMYHFGVTWVVVYFVSVYKIAVKYKNVVPLYIRLYLIGTLISSPFSFPYHTLDMAVVWLFVLYVSNRYISSYKNNKVFLGENA